MGFFKRKAVDANKRTYRKKTGALHKSKFEKKAGSKKKVVSKEDEEIPSSSDENEEDFHEARRERGGKATKGGLAGVEEEEEEQYEDEQELVSREAKRLLEGAQQKVSSRFGEKEDELMDMDGTRVGTETEQREKQQESARAHREVASLIRIGGDKKLVTHRLTPICLCFSSDSNFLVSCAKDGTLVKYDLKLSQRVNILKSTSKNGSDGKNKKKQKPDPNANANAHQGHITCCAVSPNDKYLVTGGTDRLIKIWDFVTFEFIRQFDGHRGPITALRFRHCEALELFSSSTDRSIMVWNLDEMGLMNTLYGHQDAIEQLDVLQWPRIVSCGGMDKSVRLFKVLEDSHLVFNGFAECVSIDCVALINEEHFISGSVDGSLYIWSVARKKPVCVRRGGHEKKTAGNDGTINSSGTSGQAKSRQKVKPAVSNGEPRWICAVAALPYTDLVASGSSDGFLRLWRVGQDWKSLEQVAELEMPGFVNDIRFAPDGRSIACAVGQEHKRGRWWSMKGVRNRIVLIPLVDEMGGE